MCMEIDIMWIPNVFQRISHKTQLTLKQIELP